MLDRLEPLTLMPHGYCLSWQPGLIAALVIGNVLIALAYFTIPFVILKFIRQRSDIDFKQMHWLFAGFIVSCGITHLLHVIELWIPVYYIEAVMDILTAIISIIAAVMLWKLLPIVVSMPSFHQLSEANEKLKKTAAELQDKERQLRNLSDSLPDSFLFQYAYENSKPKFKYVSSGIKNLIGHEAEQVMHDATLLMGKIDPIQRDAYFDAEMVSLRDLSNFSMDLHVQNVNGEWLWLHVTSKPRQSRDEQIVWDGIATDITNRHLLETEINRLAQAVEQNPIGILISDTNGVVEYMNEACTRISGYQFADTYEKPLTPRQIISSELSDIEYQAIHAKLHSGKTWGGEMLNRRKNGKPYWEQITVAPIFDNQRNVTKYLYLRQDISERKSSDEKLKLAAGVFTNAHEGILITDLDGTILDVNDTFCRITGFSHDEVIGKNPKILSSGRQNKDFYNAMWASLIEKGQWNGELWNRRKNGELIAESLTISAVNDELGNHKNYVALFSDITQRKVDEEKIFNLGFYDALTGLPNRRMLMDRLHTALISSSRTDNFGAILFLDMDRFKTLNDTLGHDFGDLLLIEVAQRTKSCVREDDTVARLGGDEFVVLLKEIDAQAEVASQKAAIIAEKIRAALTLPYQLNNVEQYSSPSIGVCLYRGTEESVDSLLKYADMAMYQVKESGRNSVRFFDPAMQLAMEKRATLEADLRRAVSENQLHLYYQVQVDNENRPIGAEALLRWVHPTLGMVSPVQFIPIAEASSLILDIGAWVMDKACLQLSLWAKEEHTRHLKLAVNVSAQQFKQRDFVENVLSILHANHVEPGKLKLELTETVVLNDVNDVVSKMHALKGIGVGLSMDDFGTGYSSLSYLKLLPLDQLKIDQSFVRDIATDINDAVMVQTMIDLAKNFRLNVIAEGVETDAQHTFLKNHGCLAYQGYLFSKPLPIEEFEALIK